MLFHNDNFLNPFFQFLRLARSLRFYGYLQFKPCITNYPEEDTRVIISVGDRELNFRLQTPDVSTGKLVHYHIVCWVYATTN